MSLGIILCSSNAVQGHVFVSDVNEGDVLCIGAILGNAARTAVWPREYAWNEIFFKIVEEQFHTRPVKLLGTPVCAL